MASERAVSLTRLPIPPIQYSSHAVQGCTQCAAHSGACVHFLFTESFSHVVSLALRCLSVYVAVVTSPPHVFPL